MSDLSLQRVGPTSGGTGTASPFRADITGAQAVTDAHGRLREAASRGQLFWAANQAATTWSIALATTHTGLVVSNPANSGKTLSMLRASLVLAAAPAAIAPVGLFAGFAAAGLVTHTTPLVPLSAYINQDVASGVAKADAAGTLPGTPRWVEMFLGGFTAAALFAHGGVIDLAGAYEIPPGGYFGIGSITAISGIGSLLWEEIPILA